MARALIIPTRFSASDDLSPTIRRMRDNAMGLGDRLEVVSARSARAFRRLTPALSEASRQLLSMVGTAAVVSGAFQLGRSSVQSVMDYETAIQSLQAVTGVSNSEIGGFKKEINDLASKTKESSIDVTKSFETIGSAMSQYLEDPKGLRQIADAGITLAKAGRTELQPTLESLTSIMNQFGLKAGDAAKSVNILTAGEIVGAVRTSEASAYLQEFGATAKNMNVDLAESTALIEALGMQMSKDKIGVGARNILTVISAAGGLDKKAQSDLEGAGVSMNFLMDKTQSLSARLHELSKIAGDPIKMVSVFGRENLTAGQVIFNQLGRYDEFAAKIRTTAKADEQAAINSSTLKKTIDQLGNAWTNMLTRSDGATSGLERAKSAIRYVTDNLETIVGVGINVIKFYALWKVANIGATLAVKALNIAHGIKNALFSTDLVLTNQNVLAQRAFIITSRIGATALGVWDVAVALATGNMIAFNAALAANPIGIAVVAVAALAAGIGYLIFQHDRLIQEYEEEARLRLSEAYNQEIDTVEKLAKRYIDLGWSKDQALKSAIRYEQGALAADKRRVESELRQTHQQLAEKRFYFNGLTFNKPFSGANELEEKALTKQKHLTEIAQQSLALTNYAISKSVTDEVTKKKYDLSDTQFSLQDSRDLVKAGGFESTKVSQAQMNNTTTTNNASAIVTIKNESNSTVDVSDGKTKTYSVMPSTSSTMSTKK